MIFRISLLSVLLICFTNLSAQEKAIYAIKRSDAAGYMKYLSSDALEGRRTGSEGNKEAAGYISTRAAESGVRPLPGRSDLFQNIEYIKISHSSDSSYISICDTTGRKLYTSGIKPLMTPSKDIDLSGEIVFAGYGYLNSEAKYNDLQGISVKDRIVMVMSRNPDLAGSGMPDTDSGIEDMIEVRKLPMLVLQKAKAILYVADPALSHESDLNSLAASGTYTLIPPFTKPSFNFYLDAYIISRETADMIIGRANHDLESLQELIAATKKPVSFVIPEVKAEIGIRIRTDSVISSNIIGYIEGSDSLLKNECVIYTAHYDHSGRDGSGNVLNGANDNASGAIGLLNVAKAFASLERKPLRSIVFLWTTGEEEGLHGSSYYIENPLFPLENTVANINFDMIGRSRRETDTGKPGSRKYDITGKDTIRIISAHDCNALINATLESCHQSGIFPLDDGKGSHFSGSDHYSFYKKGIPAVFFFTGLHSDYHKSTDDFEFIDFEKLIKVSRAGFLTGYQIANTRERPVVTQKEQ